MRAKQPRRPRRPVMVTWSPRAGTGLALAWMRRERSDVMPIGCKPLKFLDRVLSITTFLRIRSHRLASSIDDRRQQDAMQMRPGRIVSPSRWPEVEAAGGVGGLAQGPGLGAGAAPGRTDAVLGMERDCDAEHYTGAHASPPGWRGEEGLPPRGLGEKNPDCGVVVVPRAPTPAMVEAGRKAFAQGDPVHVSHARVLWIWMDMIDAMERDAALPPSDLGEKVVVPPAVGLPEEIKNDGAVAWEALRVIAGLSVYEWSETRGELHDLIDAMREVASKALAERPPTAGQLELLRWIEECEGRAREGVLIGVDLGRPGGDETAVVLAGRGGQTFEFSEVQDPLVWDGPTVEPGPAWDPRATFLGGYWKVKLRGLDWIVTLNEGGRRATVTIMPGFAYGAILGFGWRAALWWTKGQGWSSDCGRYGGSRDAG